MRMFPVLALSTSSRQARSPVPKLSVLDGWSPGASSVVFVRVAVMDHESACVGGLLRSVSRRACVCCVAWPAACGLWVTWVCGLRCSIAGLNPNICGARPETFSPGKKLPACTKCWNNYSHYSTREREKKQDLCLIFALRS